uniref:Uncharacterized protein n=1 Tax=Oncorhynchus mykiss TaxID=8022 RepID=A0A8C7NVB9_ONCMY
MFVTPDPCHPSHNLLVLLNHYYEDLDCIALSDMACSEISELLEKLGFYKKAQPEDVIPVEFCFSPAKDSPFKGTPKSQSSPSSAPPRQRFLRVHGEAERPNTMTYNPHSSKEECGPG